MGMYDTYGNVQIKIGPCELNDYEEGDKVPLMDGVYVGHEGIVVIIDGVFAGEFSHLTYKWGGVIEPEDLLSGHNPVEEAVKEEVAKHDDSL